MTNFEREMEQCLKLAEKGLGETSPNPMVGCIVLNKFNEQISEGYHKKYGQLHAEREALNKIDKDSGHTLIVNLEPCCHHGKTPPCTDIIIEKGIKRVVYGMKDPNPLVAGKGLQILKNAGIEIIGPILEDKCKKLNEIFIKNKTMNEVFVAIKTATTIDGKIATKTGNSKWITSEKSRNESKKLRTHYDAILTSSSTIIADNPEMIHKNKIILDRELKTDIDSKIYKQGNIYVFCACEPKKLKPNITYIKTPVIDNKLDIKFILDYIYKQGIMSIFAEAGGKLSSAILPYADKIYHFVAPKILADNSGLACFDGRQINNISDTIQFQYESSKFLNPDTLNIYTKQ